ncbi:Tic22 family protein [Salix suchowensis]|nr:Tic22 family protein [Salix suchowensis]
MEVLKVTTVEEVVRILLPQTPEKARELLIMGYAVWVVSCLFADERMMRNEGVGKEGLSKDCLKRKSESNPFLPKVTMVGVSTGDAGQLSKSSLKKTMEDLTKELEQTDEANDSVISNSSSEFKINDKDPLFVANVGDYYSEGVG